MGNSSGVENRSLEEKAERINSLRRQFLKECIKEELASLASDSDSDSDSDEPLDDESDTTTTEEIWQNDDERQITLVFLGQTGAGKSTAIKTILASCNSDSKLEPTKRYFQRYYEIEIKDGNSTSVSSAHAVQEPESISSIRKQVFVLCFNICSITMEDREMLKKNTDVFGKEMFSSSIIVFTKFDDFLKDNPKGSQKELPVDANEIAKEFGMRYCCFDNTASGENRSQQSESFFEKMEELIHPYKGYKRHITLVILGKTGTEKSETINTILASCYSKSVLKTPNEYFPWHYEVLIIEIAGNNTSISSTHAMQELQSNFSSSENLKHIFVFCFCINICSITTADHEMIKHYTNIFGKEMISSSIIVFTKFDVFLENNPKGSQKELPVDANEIAKEFGMRYCCFDNTASGENRSQQSKRFFEKVEELIYPYAGYIKTQCADLSKRFFRNFQQHFSCRCVLYGFLCFFSMNSFSLMNSFELY